MPQFRITAPDGSVYNVTGPDGATEEQALAQVQAQHAPESQASAQAAPPQQTSQALGFYQGAMKPIDNLATALDAAAKHLGMNVDTLSHALGLPTTDEAVKAHADYVAGQQAKGVQPGTFGRIAGEMVGTAPVLALSTNPIAAGAMSGALTTDAKDVGGVLKDAAIGGIAGKVGDVALKGVGKVIAPQFSPAVQKLQAEGVTMTPGQMTGGLAKRIEDTATSIPVTGDVIKSAQRRSLESFNRAAVNRTLTPIGEKLPDDVATGHEAVAHAQAALDNAYDTLLPKLTVTKDGRYLSEMGNLRNLAQNLPPDAAKTVTSNLDTIDASFSPGAGKMSGDTMKALESDLGRLTRGLRSSSVGSERLTGDALAEAQSILRDTVARSNPTQAAELKNINRGYANLVRIERAASGAKDGIFTPAQLQTATRVTDSSVRKKASARGGALMQDLATAGRDVLPSSVPDSGTFTRSAFNAFAGGAAGMLEPNALAAGIAGAAAYTRPGQAVLNALMTARPKGAQGIANALARLKGPAAIAGAPILTGAANN